MKVLGEKAVVNVSEVDAVGGAKPEPEERPYHVITKTEQPTQKVVDQFGVEHTVAVLKAAYAIETYNVADVAEAVGKFCGNCKHFSKAYGQREMARVDSPMGTPEEKRVLTELRFNVSTQVNGDMVPAAEIFDDSATEGFMSEMGACFALGNMFGSTTWMHPSQNGCPKEGPDRAKLPFMYEPRDSHQEAIDKQVRDDFLFTAALKK